MTTTDRDHTRGDDMQAQHNTCQAKNCTNKARHAVANYCNVHTKYVNKKPGRRPTEPETLYTLLRK